MTVLSVLFRTRHGSRRTDHSFLLLFFGSSGTPDLRVRVPGASSPRAHLPRVPPISRQPGLCLLLRPPPELWRLTANSLNLTWTRSRSRISRPCQVPRLNHLREAPDSSLRNSSACPAQRGNPPALTRSWRTPFLRLVGASVWGLAPPAGGEWRGVLETPPDSARRGGLGVWATNPLRSLGQVPSALWAQSPPIQLNYTGLGTHARSFSRASPCS